MNYCGKAVGSRSQFTPEGGHRCYAPPGHKGRCSEFPFLEQLEKEQPRVASKVKRDAIMTTGASWKSEDAGPNRIRRWVMLRSDDELRERHGINMTALKPQVQSKLREKAAEYTDCMDVAIKLTWLVYGMHKAPAPTDVVRRYLEARFGPIIPGTTACLVCAETLEFGAFSGAVRGKAEIETAHSNPRLHTPENVGFAHRFCNIAQGNKNLDEFYDWIESILRRRGRI